MNDTVDVATNAFCRWFVRLYGVVILGGILLVLGHTAHCQNYNTRYVSPANMQGHPQHADVVTLPTGGSYAVASGDNPGSNVPTPPAPEPLGTAARRLKAVQDAKPKAKVCYTNQ